ILERNVVGDVTAAAGLGCRAGDVNAVNIAADRRVVAVVVHVVADDLDIGGFRVDARPPGGAAPVRVLDIVDVVADDLGVVPRGVEALAAARRPGHVEALDGHVGPVVRPGRARPAGDFGAPPGVGDIGDVGRGRAQIGRAHV